MASVIDDLAWSEGRRRKALIVVLACSGLGPPPTGWVRQLAAGFWLDLDAGGLRLPLRRGRSSAAAANAAPSAEGVVPAIDALVAARDEEQIAVGAGHRWLDYPADRLKLWVMDDGSQTAPEILNQLSGTHSFCRCAAGPAMPVAVNPGL